MKHPFTPFFQAMSVMCAVAIGAASCSKEYHEFVKVTISQGGESVMLRGYLQQPNANPWLYRVEVMECGVPMVHEVLIPAGEVYAELHYQTNCAVGPIKIIWDDILRQ